MAPMIDLATVNGMSRSNFIAAFGKRNLESYPIHLKLETGMNRLGFRQAELDQLFEVLQNHPGIVIQSVFSHLAASDQDTVPAPVGCLSLLVHIRTKLK